MLESNRVIIPGKHVQHFPAAQIWLPYAGPQFWAKAADASATMAKME
jgi:hypothetical protein